MRKKLSALVIIAGLLCGLCMSSALAEESQGPKLAPVSPEFLQWKPQDGMTPDMSDGTTEGSTDFRGGDIPSPIDRSELWKNPPRPRVIPGRPTPDGTDGTTLPVSYDIRPKGGVSAIRDQRPWGSCWAFASIGSLESSYLMKYHAASVDLSEMHVAYFVYGDPREGKAFGTPRETEDLMDQGGNADQAIALFSRAWTVSESVLPYAASKTYTAPSLWPESYDFSGIRLKEAYTLGLLSGDDMMNTVKNLIMTVGAVKISYYAGDGANPSTVAGTSTRPISTTSRERARIMLWHWSVGTMILLWRISLRT